MERLAVMGMPVDVGTHYGDWLLDRQRRGQGARVVTLNAEMAMQGDRSPDLKAVIQQADLVIPDGAGIVLYFRLKGKRVRRCPGIELASDLLGRVTPEQPVFFYGGAPGVAAAAAAHWQQQNPGLRVAGIAHGFLSPEEAAALPQTLAAVKPALILLALGVPRQEFWLRDHFPHAPQAIWMGVGGSFDIWAGLKERAPAWFCDHHLEWLYRLYQEPWRWRRMLALPKFALRALTYRDPLVL